MDRGIITINETGVVTIPIAPIWMTKFEIADIIRQKTASFELD